MKVEQKGNLLIEGEDVWIPKSEYEELKEKAACFDRIKRMIKFYENDIRKRNVSNK